MSHTRLDLHLSLLVILLHRGLSQVIRTHRHAVVHALHLHHVVTALHIWIDGTHHVESALLSCALWTKVCVSTRSTFVSLTVPYLPKLTPPILKKRTVGEIVGQR